MRVKVLYFASLREALGLAGEELELPAAVNTVAALREHLLAQGRTALATARNLRCAVDQEMARPATPLCEGCEVAFFPPVTGG
ncbi:MAG: molybdopterin converting factor subunit 1 [Pseudomonadota bacterium]|jgi:molybdopterin synthase sulfur carrier subunit